MDQSVPSLIAVPTDALLRQRLDGAITQVNEVLVGKNRAVRMAFACALAGGHLLVEDVPIVGVSVFDRDSGGFRFQPGPIFAQLLLADEINRATPKTQSALLEAMAEGQVTVDGASRALPQPFLSGCRSRAPAAGRRGPFRHGGPAAAVPVRA